MYTINKIYTDTLSKHELKPSIRRMHRRPNTIQCSDYEMQAK